MRLSLKNKGYTILELMISTVVFGVLLLIISGIIVQITKQYYKGLIKARTEQVARNVAEEIASNIQYTKDDPLVGIDTVPPSDVKGYCIGERLYSVVKHQQLGSGTDVVIQRTEDCSAPPTNAVVPGATELIGKYMRVSKFDITGTGDIWTVEIKVIYGDDDLLDDHDQPTAKCKGGSGIGAQFCAEAEHTITVVRRL